MGVKKQTTEKWIRRGKDSGEERREGQRQIGPPALSQYNAGQSRLRDYLLRQSLSIACDEGRAGATDS